MTINNVIIILALIYLIIQYKRNKLDSVCIALMVSYVCLPVIKFSNGRGINSAYIITLVICLLGIREFIKKNIKFDKISLLYIGAMFASIGVTMIGWLVNGTPRLSDIINFTGVGQYVVGTYLFSRLILAYRLEKNEIIVKGIKWIVGLNLIVCGIQTINWNIGNSIVRQLYTYAGKEGPINLAEKEMGWARTFGTFYSPSVLGAMGLIMSTFMLHMILKEKRITLEYAITYIGALALGLLAFSKLAILGIPLIAGISFVFVLIQSRNMGLLKVMLKMCMIIVISYVMIVLFQWQMGYYGPVRYYYLQTFNIQSALESRYAGIVTDQTELADELLDNELLAEEIEKDGMVSEAVQIFREHPVIGVGPAQVKNEFLGDSEYIGILHNGGVINFLIHAVLYGILGVYWLIKKGNRELFTLLAIGISGVSIMVFSYGCIIPFLAMCIIESEKKEAIM